VLMDSALVDISSEEVCRRLRSDPRIGDTPIVVVGTHLCRSSFWHKLAQHPGGSSANPATRKEALDRIHILLERGQFHLFSESPEKAENCPECNKRLAAAFSTQSDG